MPDLLLKIPRCLAKTLHQNTSLRKNYLSARVTSNERLFDRWQSDNEQSFGFEISSCCESVLSVTLRVDGSPLLRAGVCRIVMCVCREAVLDRVSTSAGLHQSLRARLDGSQAAKMTLYQIFLCCKQKKLKNMKVIIIFISFNNPLLFYYSLLIRHL